MAKATAKELKYKLRLDDTNRRSTVQGILVSLLEDTKKQVFPNFPAVFKAFEDAVDIDDALKRINPQGKPKEEFWKADIRNASKDIGVHDKLTHGELLALKGGGFALPTTDLVDQREVREIRHLTGFDPPLVKKKLVKKKSDADLRKALINDPTFWADIVESILADLDQELIVSIVSELAERYDFEVE